MYVGYNALVDFFQVGPSETTRAECKQFAEARPEAEPRLPGAKVSRETEGVSGEEELEEICSKTVLYS